MAEAKTNAMRMLERAKNTLLRDAAPTTTARWPDRRDQRTARKVGWTRIPSSKL